MATQISAGLKTTFLVHALVGLILGLLFLVIPETIGGLLGWRMTDPSYRVLGAAVTGFGFSSWLAYRAGSWDQVKILVQMELVWLVLGALAALWGLLTGGFPAVAWVFFGISVIFAVAFGFCLRAPSRETLPA